MAEEASVVIIMQGRDEASGAIANVGTTMAQSEIQALQLNVALVAMGSALSAVGSLVNQIDNPMAKMAGTFLMTAGAIMTTVSAIVTMIPQIKSLVAAIKSWTIVQSIALALSGVGIPALIAGLAVAGVATAAIVGMTGGFGGGGGDTFNINAGVVVADRTSLNTFAGMVKRNIDERGRTGR